MGHFRPLFIDFHSFQAIFYAKNYRLLMDSNLDRRRRWRPLGRRHGITFSLALNVKGNMLTKYCKHTTCKARLTNVEALVIKQKPKTSNPT